MQTITLLDYGAGNVRSVRNAIRKLGYEVRDVSRPEDILAADKLIFPGVGAFGAAMQRLNEYGYTEPLREYLRAGRPFLGICIGLQSLFEGSEESPGVAGLRNNCRCRRAGVCRVRASRHYRTSVILNVSTVSPACRRQT